MNAKLFTILGFLLVFGLAFVYIAFIIGPKIFSNFKLSSVIPPTSPTPSASSPNISPSPIPADFKIFTSALGMSFNYPAKWGLLTCSNSNNFELDPTNPQDELNVICTDAKKPISVVFESKENMCGVEKVKMGNIEVFKGQLKTESYLTYSWCVNTNPPFEITNRESQTTNVAADSKNYVDEIDKIIGSIQFN